MYPNGQENGGQPSFPEPDYEVPDDIRNRAKILLIVLIGVPYMAFFGWCLYLMTVLPSVSGVHDKLIGIGSLSSMLGAGILMALCGLAISHVVRDPGILPTMKYLSMAKVVLIFLPGVIMGFYTPTHIKGEPNLTMYMVSPNDPEVEIVAPIALTFSVEEAIKILARRGLRPITYGWDYDGDGQKNEDTVVPTATAVYDRAGSYNVVVRIQLSDGSFRRLVRRLVIPNDTFSVKPARTVVDEPVIFSIKHLVDDKQLLTEVQWDFDSDGNVDEVTSELQVSNTFLRLGPIKVSALVVYSNQTQKRYEREVDIVKPLPLPFDISIKTEPDYLVSPAPFGTFFSVETEENLRDVKWDFGDDTDEQVGFRVGHTFRNIGSYRVTATARSGSGDIARLNTLVKIVPPLSLPDMAFNGTPEVDLGRNVIEGEVPLSLNLTPITSQPLIEFFWEAPDATDVGSLQTTLQAIYRRPGRYTVTLIGQDPEGRAMRRPLIVNVKPPSNVMSLKMRPPDGGVAPLEVTFDASETSIPGEEISGFSWIFDDKNDSPEKPGSAVMRHTYTEPGTYTVRASAQTTTGNRLEATKTIVVRPPLLDACFRVSRDTGKAPLGVKFTMDCTTGNSYTLQWDFGDGTVSDQRDPIHVFERPGTFPVTLTIQDSLGSKNSFTMDIVAQP